MSNQPLHYNSRITELPRVPSVILIVLTATFFAVFFSQLIPPLMGLSGMGLAMIYSAFKHKQESWIAGLFLGLCFAIIGIGGIVGLVFF